MFRDSFKIAFGITLGIGLAKAIVNLPKSVLEISIGKNDEEEE